MYTNILLSVINFGGLPIFLEIENFFPSSSQDDMSVFSIISSAFFDASQ